VNEARHILHRDIETRSTLDLTDVGAWRYAAEPTTGVWCVGYAIDDGPAQIWISDQPIPEVFFIAARDPDWLIVAHNDAFEQAIEERILAPRFGWPIVPIERHRCTMAVAVASALPGSLDRAAEVLNSPFRKDIEGRRLMRKMARPRKPRAGEDPNGLYWHDEPENQARLQKYCMRDIEAERWLYQWVPPLIDSEQVVWTCDQRINWRGFHVDVALLNAAHHVVTETGAALQTEFRELTGLDSTNQTAKLIAWLTEHGCPLTDVQKGTLRHALRRKDLQSAAGRAIELRLQLAHASAGKVEALLAWRDADGRVRGTLKFHGAGTGRWAGSGPPAAEFSARRRRH
jgi:DNA polymerase